MPRLRRSRPDLPGISRKGAGRGFRYLTPDGAAVIRLRFPAKSRQTWTSEIEDAELCAALAPLLERPRTGRLFAWQDEDGRWRPISADLINADVGRRTGLDATAKDFRTLRGTVVAATELAAHGPQASEAARTRVIALAMRAAAEELGNTPAVARASDVDPRVVEAFRRDEVIELRPRLSAEAALRGTSNGPTEAINGRLEHLRGSALGFRNLTNYIARALLESGGFRPLLHPRLR